MPPVRLRVDELECRRNPSTVVGGVADAPIQPILPVSVDVQPTTETAPADEGDFVALVGPEPDDPTEDPTGGPEPPEPDPNDPPPPPPPEEGESSGPSEEELELEYLIDLILYG